MHVCCCAHILCGCKGSEHKSLGSYSKCFIYWDISPASWEASETIVVANMTSCPPLSLTWTNSFPLPWFLQTDLGVVFQEGFQSSWQRKHGSRNRLVHVCGRGGQLVTLRSTGKQGAQTRTRNKYNHQGPGLVTSFCHLSSISEITKSPQQVLGAGEKGKNLGNHFTFKSRCRLTEQLARTMLTSGIQASTSLPIP